MKALLVTLGIILLLGFSTQLLRHLYVMWISPTTSVLDEYKDKTEKEFTASESLDELLKQYDEAYRKNKEWEVGKTPEEIAKRSLEQRQSMDNLKQAIEAWETRSQDISELQFFWWCGVCCGVLGIICFGRVNQ